MANTIKITAKTVDQASGPIDNIRDKLDKIKSQGAKGFGLGVGAAAGTIAFNALGTAISGATGFLEDSVTKAREEEVGIGRLNAALKANVSGWDGNRDAIETVIAAREKLAFSDGEQRDALSQLVTRTHDVTAALKLEREAMDLARLKGISLADSAAIIGKVYGGNVSILSRYGIAVKKGATSTEALAEIQKAAADQADTFAKTGEGAAQSFQIAIDDLQESLGGLVDGPMTDIIGKASDDVRSIQGLIDSAKELGKNVEDTGLKFPEAGVKIDVFGNLIDFVRKGPLDGFNQVAAKHGFVMDRFGEHVDGGTDAINDFRRGLGEAGHSAIAAQTRIQNVGKAAGITGAKFSDMRDAIREAAGVLNEQKRGHEETTLKIKGTELSLKDANRELHKLEDIKHPTLDQQIDMNNLRQRILEDRDQLTLLRADLAAAGKVTMPVTKSWIDKLTDSTDEAGDKAHELYNWLNKVSNLPGGGGGGGGASTGGGGGHNTKQDNIPRAGGGPVLGGQSYLVGERGPEMFVPGGSGNIVPNNKLGGAGLTINVNLNGGGMTPGASMRIAEEVGPAIARWMQQRQLI